MLKGSVNTRSGRPLLEAIAQGDEDASEVTDKSDLDDRRQFDFPNAADSLHVVVAVLAELFRVVIQAEQVQPFIHRLRSGWQMHFVQRRRN